MLKALHLERFRNYRALHREFEPGLCVVVGRNAQGKTNLLEAIALLSTARLLRARRSAEAILEGESDAVVRGTLERGTEIAVRLEAGRAKRCEVNGMGLPRGSDLIGYLPSVSFTNQDLEIVRGEPADRRFFLDAELSQTFPAYLQQFTKYRHALDQRNALLKMAQDRPVQPELLETWEDEMASYGASIRVYRQRFLEELAPITTTMHGAVGSGEAMSLRYQPNEAATDRDALLSALRDARIRDLHRGTTSVGPHRDDFALEIGGREARAFGSQGQQRTAAVAIKLATLNVTGEHLGTRPMLLLDDIFSELDAGRRENMLHVAEELAGQVVLTCTDREQVGERMLAKAQVIEISAGAVVA